MAFVIGSLVATLTACGSSEPEPLSDEQLTERVREFEGLLGGVDMIPENGYLVHENLFSFTTRGGACQVNIYRQKEPPPGKDTRSSERVLAFYVQADQIGGVSLGMTKLTPGDKSIKDHPQIKPCFTTGVK